MFSACMALCAMALQAPNDVEAKIIAASLFKNGNAVVVREIPLSGSETLVRNLPKGSLGTVWIYCDEKVKLGDIVTTTIQPPVGTKAKSLDDLLAMNEGKIVTLKLQSSSSETESLDSVTGRIVNAEGSLVVIESGGETLAYKKAQIQSVSSKGEGLRWAQGIDTDSQRLKIKWSGPEGSKAYIVSYELGATWAPAFSVDISDPKKLRLTAKAVVLDDIANFDNANIRLVTGYPNIKYSELTDPLLSSMQTSEFVESLVSDGVRFSRMKGKNLTANFTNSAPDLENAAPKIAKPDDGQLGDLFFYPLNDVNLQKGERGYFNLFVTQCDYIDLYTWGYGDQDLAFDDSDSKDVWHCLKFKNSQNIPWTSGPIITMKNGQMLGQDQVPYTRSNGQAIVRITKALEIQTDHRSEEIGRVRGAMKDRYGNATHDISTVKEIYKVRNLKSEAIKVLVHKTIEGKILESTGKPTINPLVRNIEELNPSYECDWILEIEPGKTATVTVTRKAYVEVEKS